VWPVLTYAQPLNAAVFTLDGLVLASQGYAPFAFLREMMEVGTGLVFLPALYLFYLGAHHRALSGVWLAKVALNVWRCAALASRVAWWLGQVLGKSRLAHAGSAEPLLEPLLSDGA